MDEQNNSIFGQESDPAPVRGERSVILTALCGYFFVTWILLALRIVLILLSTPFSVLSQVSGQEILTAFGFSSVYDVVYLALSVVAVIGIWLMRKWGAYLFGITVLGYLVYIIVTVSGLQAQVTAWSVISGLITTFVVPVVMAVFSYKSLKRMS